ncbi:chromosome partitioning protein ParA [Methylobacterium sp. J-090]|uniref:chromosome partitioning protein ParA n=1 Tax=Methylobacterium sp. J-090 TaxID=2836666 RepID=UPI001FB9CC32|nr:chromosome partitioning protein ParA [Methylobacterium sp. J-090]MCJ2079850.1 chromosome partitioning protein ParA [Methylobacterium sp. J-090]
MTWMPFGKSKSIEHKSSDAPSIDSKQELPFASDEILSYNNLNHSRNNSNISTVDKFSIDSVGQQNEIVRFRVAEMAERLEELKSLQGDFSAILEPIIAITDELPKARIRISEVETLLALEQTGAATMRRDLAEASKRLAEVTNDYSATAIQLHHLETSLQDRDATGEELRVNLREKSLVAENLERQLFAETEQTRALLGESKALRSEAKSLDQALVRSESELQDVREARNLLDQDNQRLQALSEEQAVKIAELAARSQDFEVQADSARNVARNFEQQLANALSASQKADAHYDVEVSTHRTERASLAMRLEAATGRLATTDQMLVQLRNQLRERDEVGRTAERGLKEAAIERVTMERRLESVQADLARQTERFLEMQRSRSELDHRCDMFAKAIAAKDAALEQATGRIASLSDRIEQLIHRQEVERSDFEVVNHRLVEELQHERSERKMAQGALDIARESRVSLQKQHEALKRAARSFTTEETASRPEAATVPPPEPSNVRPFMPAEKI